MHLISTDKYCAGAGIFAQDKAPAYIARLRPRALAVYSALSAARSNSSGVLPSAGYTEATPMLAVTQAKTDWSCGSNHRWC